LISQLKTSNKNAVFDRPIRSWFKILEQEQGWHFEPRVVCEPGSESVLDFKRLGALRATRMLPYCMNIVRFLQIAVLETRIDFFNVAVEEFSVPASDQGASDRGLIVSFMVAREYREAIKSKLLLGGFRLVLRVRATQCIKTVTNSEFTIAEVHQRDHNSTAAGSGN